MGNDLIEIFGRTIHTYGVLTAVAFVVGVKMVIRRGKIAQIEPKTVYEIAFPILITSLLGARVVYIITNIPHFYNLCQNEGDCFAIFKLWDGGGVFFGGLIGGIIGFYIFTGRYKVNRWLFADTAIIALPIGHAIGRLGCFSAGCCYGHTTNLPIGVEFPTGSIPYQDHLAMGYIDKNWVHSLTIHPVQLYEASLLVLLFLFIWHRFVNKRFHGEIVLIYLIGYSIIRFIMEIFRGDSIRKHLFEFSPKFLTNLIGLPEGSPIILSTSQFISILIVIFTFFIWKKWGTASKPQ